MTLHSNWPPCDVDPRRGTASFDGVVIKADPIMDPRWDRVFPILEEEQVVMCRQMQALLQNAHGALALDIGTGSGVFAIWAARHGCRVIALDVSPRAVKLTRRNAEANQIPTVLATDELEPGAICPLNVRFDYQFAEEWAGRFDFAFMNPPYNPTFEGVFPALHCEAGEDGQRVFVDEMRPVPHVLRDGGVCVGDQFTLADATGHTTAEDVIVDAFGSACRLRLAPLVDGMMPVREFLTAQYASYLERPLKPGSQTSVQRYIDRVAAQASNFAVVYYEIQKTDVGEARPVVEHFQLEQTPGFGWDVRVWEHRCFVDYTSPLLGPNGVGDEIGT